MLVLKDLLPLMRENDVRLLDSDGNEICLLRKDHTQEILSEKISQYDCRQHLQRRGNIGYGKYFFKKYGGLIS